MKTAIITGGTGTIGAALVKEFSKDYEVTFTYLNNKDGAAALEREYGARGFRCDVSDSAEVAEIAEVIRAASTAPHCDLLINNAGIAEIKLFTDITDGDWEKMLGVNLSGAFYFSRAVIPQMISRKSGSIINISSIWGNMGASCEAHYSAAKAGLIGLTKALAKEAGLSGVRVNCIAPGVIEGKMNGGFSPEEIAGLKGMCALNRLGKPEDVAGAARFLESADFVTGQVISVDGGIF